MPLQIKNDELLTVPEAAKYLGYAEVTIRTYLQRNLLKHSKIGSAVLIAKSECDRFSVEKRPPGRPKMQPRKKN